VENLVSMLPFREARTGSINRFHKSFLTLETIYSLVSRVETQTQTQTFEKKFESKEGGKDIEYVLEFSTDERGEVKHVKITKVLYPLECCSNNIKTIIEVKRGETEPYRIEIYMVRDSWNGTGRDDLFAIEFNDYGYESPAFLSLDTLEIINSIDQLKEYIKDIIEYIRHAYMMSVEPFIE